MHRVADAIAASMVAHGTDRAFNVPGESFLALLDALVDVSAIDLVTCRHEGSAALAAIADAKLTGRPGVVLVSRGPGLANAMIGIHVAAQDAVPLIVLVGQVDTPNLGRDAVQEIDPKEFRSLLKWTARIDQPVKAIEVIARAYTAASAGTPGPVVVELPEDVLGLPAYDTNVKVVHGFGVARTPDADVESAARLLASAQRPLLLIGGQNRSDQVREALLGLSDAARLPVLVTNKNQDLFPGKHHHWAGHLGFFAQPLQAELINDADLVLAVGTRLGDVATLGWTVPRGEGQQLVHVYPDPAQIGRHFAPTLSIVSDASDFLGRLLKHVREPATDQDWLARAARVCQATEGWLAERVAREDVLGRAVSAAAARFGPSDLLTADSGNFAAWVQRAFRFGLGNRYISTSCGAMGIGVPAAVAAALRHSDRTIFCFCGDGGFMMNGNDFIIACERQLQLKVFVSNNRSYGTIRSHQQREYPGRRSGTALHGPDFVAMARAFGASGYRIDEETDINSIVDRALGERGPTLIEIVCDVDFTVSMSLQAQQWA
jgi:acetolactate synthase I/II/III large subunit